MRNQFKNYKRVEKFQALRPVTQEDINEFRENTSTIIAQTNPEVREVKMDGSHLCAVMISAPDRKKGSPKIGDMIARNADNHRDQWLISEEYFKTNFEQK
jgi:hypothetical protein